MSVSGRNSLLRRSLSNASGLPPAVGKDVNNRSNSSRNNSKSPSVEPSTQRPRLFSAPLEPTASIVAEIAAAFEENRVASPKVPPPMRSWSQRDVPTEQEKVRQLIELFSGGRTREASTVSRSATDLSTVEKERKNSSTVLLSAGRVAGSGSSVGVPTRTGRASPVKSYPEPRRWALKSPIPIRDPSPTPMRDVYSPTLPSAVTSPRTDVSTTARFWERASIDLSKGRVGSQSTVSGRPLASIGTIFAPVPSQHLSPKQAPYEPTPTTPFPPAASVKKETRTSSRADHHPTALVPQNTAATATRASHSAMSDRNDLFRLENVPKVARKYLERVNSSGNNAQQNRRSHHSPSPFFSTSPHEFSIPRAYKLKSPKYVVEPSMYRHQSGSEGSRNRLSPNPEYGANRSFASPSPKLYAGNLPEWIRGVQPPPYRSSRTAPQPPPPPPPQPRAVDADEADKERLQVPPIVYSGVENNSVDDARTGEDLHGISPTVDSGANGGMSPGANSAATTIMYGASLTSQPAPPMASYGRVKVHQYGNQGQSKDGNAEERLERLGGGGVALPQQAPAARRGVSALSRKADDGADGVCEYDSPGELYTDQGSEATLAELASTAAGINTNEYASINTNEYASPRPSNFSDLYFSRDFHHLVNSPPTGYRSTRLPTQLLSSSISLNAQRGIPNQATQKARAHSSPTILHMPPFLPTDSSHNGSALNYQTKYANFDNRGGSTVSSSYLAFAENEFAGFSDNSFHPTGSPAIDRSKVQCNDSTVSMDQLSRRGSGTGTITESYGEEAMMNYPRSFTNNSQCSTSTATLAESIRGPLLARFASLRRKAAARKGIVESNSNNDGAWDERDSFWVRMLEGKWVSEEDY